MKPRFFFFAGEKSGDAIGCRLLQELKNRHPNLIFKGVGGPQMRAHGLEAILRTEDFEVMGLSETIRQLPKIIRQFYLVRDTILKEKPDVVILIDYPGFNLKLAKSLRKKGYAGKIVQYVCPTVWAWGKNRIGKMVESLDLVLSIYPFEPACFSSTKLPVRYVGNPLNEIVNEHSRQKGWEKLFGIRSNDQLIALFPGSRRGEVRLNLPYMLKAAERIKQEFPDAVFAVSCAHDEVMKAIHGMLSNNTLKLNKDLFLLPKAFSFELMHSCRFAIAKSGSVTLELALHGKPAVVIYKLSFLNKLLAKYILKLNLPYYCIVNILKNKTIYPELIEIGLTPENLAAASRELLRDGPQRDACIDECLSVRSLLLDLKPSKQAAEEIEAILS